MFSSYAPAMSSATASESRERVRYGQRQARAHAGLISSMLKHGAARRRAAAATASPRSLPIAGAPRHDYGERAGRPYRVLALGPLFLPTDFGSQASRGATTAPTQSAR
jgi:hypothetical protein